MKQSNATDRPRPVSWIFFGLAALIMTAALELNQNRPAAFILCGLMAVLFAWLRIRVLPGKKGGVKAFAWIGWLALFLVLFFLTWPPYRNVPAFEGKDPGRTEVVSLPDGDVRGVTTEDGEVEIFAGIPYAAPPVGDLRWKAPQDPAPWEGVLEADHFAPMSMQPTNFPLYASLRQIVGFHDYKVTLKDNYLPSVSEDSLYLNVWRPAERSGKLPVLVYIHGGTLQTGQTWFGDYSGEGLARQDIIVVNLAYRLGVFGYLAEEELLEESGGLTTGNYGMLDQVKGLQWVKENIGLFGGDPDNITIAGESAGAASVSALCTSPLTEGLFQRAILESSTVASVTPPHSFRPMESALASGKALMERYGCDTVEELRDVPAEDLVGEADTQHHMTVDGYFLTETPYESYRKGAYHETAVLHGFNSEESGPFVLFDQADLKDYEGRIDAYFGGLAEEVLALYPASTDEEARAFWQEIWGAIFFDYPHYCLDRLAVKNDIPVYEYRFSKHNGRLGPWHSGELIYAYGNIPEDSRLFDARDRELSAEMSGYFRNFTATGDPNGDGLPAWEQNLSGGDLMELGDTTGMEKETGRKLGLYGILDRMEGWEL